MYPVKPEIVKNFLSELGYLGTQITTEEIIFLKDGIEVKLPQKEKSFTRNHIIALLAKTDIKTVEFDEYLKRIGHKNDNESFDRIIKLAVNTPPLKKKKKKQ